MEENNVDPTRITDPDEEVTSVTEVTSTNTTTNIIKENHLPPIEENVFPNNKALHESEDATDIFTNQSLVSKSCSLSTVSSDELLKTVISVSPSNVSESESNLSVNTKDFKALYEESQSKLDEHTEKYLKNLLKITSEYNDLKENYDELETKHEKFLADQDQYKHEKEAVVSSYEVAINEKDEVISDKNEEIETLRSKLASLTLTTPIGLTKNRDDDNFRSKSKGRKTKGSSTNVTINQCEYLSCTNKDIDLIKCNQCSKYICETCGDVPISKLKPIYNKCSTLYFFCKSCDESNPNPPNPPTQNETSSDNKEFLKSIQESFDQKFTQMESRLKTIIDEKMVHNIDICDQIIDQNSTTEASASSSAAPKVSSYASKVLRLPQEVKQMMIDAKNEDKVEENEQERRASNFIIHGADEIGDNNEELKANDTQYISEILKKIGVTSKPVSVGRVGTPNETKNRTMKIVMKTKNDQVKVMNNLGKLKGTEEQFGKIRITHDYTNKERELIKMKVKEAEEKSTGDTERVYRVRGDPKNGLRLVAFPRK